MLAGFRGGLEETAGIGIRMRCLAESSERMREAEVKVAGRTFPPGGQIEEGAIARRRHDIRFRKGRCDWRGVTLVVVLSWSSLMSCIYDSEEGARARVGSATERHRNFLFLPNPVLPSQSLTRT